MSTPESPEAPTQYPYHPEVWREIRALSELALAEFELGTDTGNGTDTYVANRWRVNRLGFACRLERAFVAPDETTVYTFGLEDDVPGQRYFGLQPYISEGLRRPAAHHPRKYGVLEYSQAQGLIKEPEGALPNNYIRSIKHVDMKDPKERIVGFEDLLKDLLGYASRGWEEPTKLPNYKKW